MTRQLAKMYLKGEWQVVRDDSAKSNPFRVLYLWRDIDNDGWPHDHRKTVKKYADFASCMTFLNNVAIEYNWE